MTIRRSQEDDEFGGFAGYAQRLESGAWTPSGLLQTIRFLLAVFTGVVAARWTILFSWPEHGDSVTNVMAAISVVLSFVFGIVIAAVAQNRARPGGTEHLLFQGAVGVLFALSFLYAGAKSPAASAIAGSSYSSPALDVAGPEQTLAPMQAMKEQLRAKWWDDLRAAGAYGPPGKEPPFLEVADDGRYVDLLNISGHDIHCLHLERVKSPANGGGQELRCRMEEKFPSGRACAYLRAESRREFVLASGSDPQCASAPLEYRIGDVDHPDPSYWTESALRHYGGEEYFRRGPWD